MEKTAKKNITLLPHEIFELIQKASGVKERSEILKENASFGLKTILQANFKDEVKFDLPAGEPPYKEDKAPAGEQVTFIEKRIPDLKHLIVQSRLPQIKKESIFISILESVHAKDAKILIAMKDKKLGKLYNKLTEAVVRKAFPNLLTIK